MFLFILWLSGYLFLKVVLGYQLLRKFKLSGFQRHERYEYVKFFTIPFLSWLYLLIVIIQIFKRKK